MKELTTIFTGRNIIRLHETDSSNSSLSELSKREYLPEGTALLADYQTGGRGQSGASWYSSRGKNLLVSYLFFPHSLPPESLFILNKSVAVGIYDCLLSYQILPVIKWPNDILVNEKKIAGVLIENVLRGSQIQYCIIGIGLNVNEDSFPAIVSNGISMKNLLGHSIDILEVFYALSNCLEAAYLAIRGKQNDLINTKYHENLYRWNIPSNYCIMNKPVKATIIKADNNGCLQLVSESGQQVIVKNKEIEYL